VIANTLGCQWTISFPSSAACIGSAPPEPQPDPGNTGDGLPVSVGTIFCIVFGLLSGGYIVVGCCYKRRRMGTEGVESCPNIDFWRELPYLVWVSGTRWFLLLLRSLCLTLAPGTGACDVCAGWLSVYVEEGLRLLPARPT
jgi:hypothetical protein